jgi:hypothetical protein
MRLSVLWAEKLEPPRPRAKPPQPASKTIMRISAKGEACYQTAESRPRPPPSGPPALQPCRIKCGVLPDNPKICAKLQGPYGAKRPDAAGGKSYATPPARHIQEILTAMPGKFRILPRSQTEPKLRSRTSSAAQGRLKYWALARSAYRKAPSRHDVFPLY